MDINKDARTELGEVGEFGLIERLGKNFGLKNPSSVKGIGDDAAVIDAGDKYLLLSTDFLVEGIHFDLSYVPLKHLGYKAVSVNVSDIAAMNGIPQQITVSLAISNRFSVEALEELYEGIRLACDDYQVDLVGGDTTSSLSGLVISVSVVGAAEKDKVVYRNTAKEGDVVCVTGDLGAAYLGLQILEREKQVFMANPEMQPKMEGKEYLIQRQLRPQARMDIIHILREVGLVPTSMMDISDGLASELFHICTQSNVGVTIYEDKLPKDEEVSQTAYEFKIDTTTCMLNGGEDYELLFTVSQEEFEKIKKEPDILPVGVIRAKEEGMTLYSKGGKIHDLQAQGWVHFKDNQ